MNHIIYYFIGFFILYLVVYFYNIYYTLLFSNYVLKKTFLMFNFLFCMNEIQIILPNSFITLKWLMITTKSDYLYNTEH